MFVTRLRNLFAVALLACGVIGAGAAVAQQYGAPTSQPPVPSPNVAFPPVAAAADAQPKPVEAKKYPAKGVEDDDVPYGSFPTQAVVRIEDGKLVVRQRGAHFEPVAQTVNGQQIVSYQRKSGVTATTHDPADVSVFDMKGNRLSPKAWKELLKSDVHVLISTDGKVPNPRELALFKQDTLLVVLPGMIASTTGGATYYVPGVPSTPQPGTVAPPAMRPTQPPRSVPTPPARTAPSGTTLPPPFPSQNLPPEDVLPTTTPPVELPR